MGRAALQCLELMGSIKEPGAARCRRVRLSLLPAGSSGCSGLDEDRFAGGVSVLTVIAWSCLHLQKACESRGGAGSWQFSSCTARNWPCKINKLSRAVTVSLGAGQLNRLVTEYPMCFSTQFRLCSGVFLAGTVTPRPGHAGHVVCQGRAGALSILCKGTIRRCDLTPVGVSGGVGEGGREEPCLHKDAHWRHRTGTRQCGFRALAFVPVSPIPCVTVPLRCPLPSPTAPVTISKARLLCCPGLRRPLRELLPSLSRTAVLRSSSFQALRHKNCHQSR